MKNFIKLGQKFTNTHCFDIISALEPDFIKDTKIKRGGLSLCGLNVKEEAEWVNGLIKMKECVANIKGNDALMADYTGLNDMIHEVYDAEKLKNHTETPFYYTTKDNLYEEWGPELKPANAAGKGKGTVNSISKIKDTIKKTTAKVKAVKKVLLKKLAKAKKTRTALQHKKDIMQNLVNSRVIAEKSANKKTVLQEQTRRREQILDKANSKIKKVKLQEIENLKKTFDDKISKEKKGTNASAMEILRCLKEEEKDLDPSECYNDKKIGGMENMTNIKTMCEQFYGEENKEKCSERTKFCGMCCGHYIGLKHPIKLGSCKTRCSLTIQKRSYWRGRRASTGGIVVPAVQPWPKSKWRGAKTDSGTGKFNKLASLRLFNVAGKIKYATTGQPMKDTPSFHVTAKAISLDKKYNGKVFKAEFSRTRFNFIGLRAGKYNVRVSRNGFVSTGQVVSITNANHTERDLFNLVTTRTLSNKQWRVVVTWDGSPKNLDSNLNINKELINSKNKKSKDGQATVDFSKNEGFGPETITWVSKPNVLYKYVVHNTSGEALLRTSHAIVRVYHGNDKEKVFHCPTSGDGKSWEVFTVKNNKLEVLNSMK